MRTTVDKELLPMKAHYFLFNAGTAPVVPFMPTLARQLGFSSVVVGTMYTILPIVGMLAKPFFSYIADRYRRHRMLFLISEIVTAVAFFLIMFIPPIPQPPPALELHCHAGVADLRYCSKFDSCIKSNLEQHFGNRTVACKLHCHAQPFMWDIVCEDWLSNSTDCPQRHNPYLDLTAFVDMDDIIMEKRCLFFAIPHARAQLEGRNVTMNCPRNKQYFNASCEIDCNDAYMARKMAESPVIKNSDAVRLYQFWWFFGMLIVSWIGMAVVVSIGDAICFTILGERHHLYGKQRLCGSIGWGLFSIVAGVLVDKTSDGITKDYSVVFWMTAVIIGLDVFASSKLKHTQASISPNILKDVGQMFLSVRCVIFFVWCVLIGMGTALIWNFLLSYLEELGAQVEGCQNSIKTLQGFAMGIQCFCGELPFFFLSGWILKKIGHVNAMSLVLFGFGVRFTLYSMLQDPWYVLPIELLNGVTFGLFYATMASYASIVAPPSAEATMQGLVGAIFEGIGVSTGSFIGGILFDVVGGGHTFEIFGVSAFIAFILHVCVQKCLQRHDASFGRQNGKQKRAALANGRANENAMTQATDSNSSTTLSQNVATDTFNNIVLNS